MTNTIKAIIVDDELSARENLADMLALYCPEVNVIASFATAEAALSEILQVQLDLLFLDISLGTNTGFDLIKQLPNDRSFDIIMVTAHENFALEAYQNSVTDYLLKPIAKTDLLRCINNFKKKLGSKNHHNDIIDVINQFKKQENKKLIVSSREGSDIIRVQDILYLEANGSYTKIVLLNGKELLSSKNLKTQLFELSDAQTIIRIHKSHAVNKNEITKIIKTPFTKIILSNNIELAVSDQYREELYQAIL